MSAPSGDRRVGGPRRVRVRVTGDVQGVSFRWYCRERAKAAGVSGFVRNLGDGSVEAAFEGKPEAIDSMIEWCRRGPPHAGVDSVEAREEDPLGEAAFRILR